MRISEPESPTENSPAFQSQTINSLVILFYKNMMMMGPKQYTTAYSICHTLAKRYKDKKHIEELEKIYKYSTNGYHLGLQQTLVYRNLMLGERLNKIFNYGYRLKPVSLGNMIVALDDSFSKILEIFTDICVKNDIDTTVILPDIGGAGASDKL